MFDIGWAELLILAVVAIIVVGPKDLPRMLYALGKVINKIRRSADEFRNQFTEAMREAGVDEIERDIRSIEDLNPAHQIRDSIDEAFRENRPQPAGKGEKESKPQAGEGGEDGWEELETVEQSTTDRDTQAPRSTDQEAARTEPPDAAAKPLEDKADPAVETEPAREEAGAHRVTRSGAMS